MNVVERADLQPGKEYYIECLSDNPIGFMVRNTNIPKLICRFIKSEGGFAYFSEFRELRELANAGEEVSLGTYWNFYEVKCHKIQNDMEARALNIILRNVLGDAYFIY